MKKDEAYRHILHLTRTGNYDWQPFTRRGCEFTVALEGVSGEVTVPQLQVNSENLVVLYFSHATGQLEPEVIKVNPLELREFLHSKFPDVSEVFNRVLNANFLHLADETKTG